MYRMDPFSVPKRGGSRGVGGVARIVSTGLSSRVRTTSSPGVNLSMISARWLCAASRVIVCMVIPPVHRTVILPAAEQSEGHREKALVEYRPPRLSRRSSRAGGRHAVLFLPPDAVAASAGGL